MCPKQCKHFGVKNARGEPEILWAKKAGVWAKNSFCRQRANFRHRGTVGKEKCIMNWNLLVSALILRLESNAACHILKGIKCNPQGMNGILSKEIT